MRPTLARFTAAVMLALVAQVCLAGPPAAVPDQAASSLSGTVTLVHAVPGRTVQVRVDGRDLHGVARAGDVIGPLRLAAGRHVVAFVGSGAGAARTTVGLGQGTSVDVVLHRPAAVEGASVVSSFRTPTQPIRSGRARILVADTATVVPADVRVDDRVVSTNIANGESATLDVKAGQHEVTLVPTGRSAPAVLGPLRVYAPAGTVTMVYVGGGPRVSALRAIVHTVAVGSGGGPAPGRVHTGTTGLARNLRVRVFGPR